MSNLRGKIRLATRQSGLSRWLQANHAWFAKELKEAGVPNWDAITVMLEKEGLTDKNGNPYSKDAVRIGIDRFFKKHPVLLAPTTAGRPPPPSATVSRETPQEAPSSETDYIALSKALKDKRTIK